MISIGGLLLACFLGTLPLWSATAAPLKADAAHSSITNESSSSLSPAYQLPGMSSGTGAFVLTHPYTELVSPAIEVEVTTETTTVTETTTATETVTDTTTETTTVTDTTTATETDTTTETETTTATDTTTATETTTATDTTTATETSTATDTTTATETSTATDTTTATETTTTTKTTTATDTATDTTTATATDTTTATATTTETAPASETSTTATSTTTPSGPSASFTWLPLDPRVGEPISLLSTSTAGSSPLASYAWQVDGEAFTAGSPARGVVFSEPGSHVVTLRVEDGGGRSSTASHTIAVSSQEVTLMQPFPVVRIAGSFSHRGATLQTLSVQAPAGATILIRCRGAGCPVRRQRRRVSAGENGASIGFRRFERLLPAGLVLKVEVFEAGEIGKLTRLVIRRGKPPQRSDTCLDPAGTGAVGCPK